MPLQNRFIDRLPDFRNLGVCLRILLLVNLMGLTAAVIQASNLQEVGSRLAELSAFLQPVLLLSLIVLYPAGRVLSRTPYQLGIVIVLLIVLALAWVVHMAAAHLFAPDYAFSLPRALLIAAIMTGIVLYYFHLRQRALSPALIE
ncbi:MAG TPA: sensor histidine kinase, partial [Methylophilaceae bacterium]|nr:sensor histidine kinase [Methylophilaceae bacterium]